MRARSADLHAGARSCSTGIYLAIQACFLGGGDDDDDEAATRWRGLVSGVAATFEPGWPRVSARAGLAFVGCYDATMTTPLASS